MDNGERPSKFRRITPAAFRSNKVASVKKVYWPQHLLPQTLPTARVLVYGYDTKIGHAMGTQPTQNTVYDFASDLLQSLEASRRQQASRPLAFVAHSLGGIIVKEALRQASNYWNYGPAHQCLHQIYASTAAIIFFGTPHGGADPRGLRELIIEKLVRAAGFSANEQIVNALMPNSERLRELRDAFLPMARQKEWLIYSFQEQQGVQALGHKKGRCLPGSK